MSYRTYYDAQTGAYLGSYSGPDDGNPFAGNPSVDGQHGGLTQLVEGAVVDAPAPRLPLPRLVVADRLTDTEVATVAALQGGNAQQQRWWLRWVSADTVNPANPDVVAGFAAVFGEDRAIELLAAE